MVNSFEKQNDLKPCVWGLMGARVRLSKGQGAVGQGCLRRQGGEGKPDGLKIIFNFKSEKAKQKYSEKQRKKNFRVLPWAI